MYPTAGELGGVVTRSKERGHVNVGDTLGVVELVEVLHTGLLQRHWSCRNGNTAKPLLQAASHEYRYADICSKRERGFLNDP